MDLRVKNLENPDVSIVMSVHNCERYIESSIDSIKPVGRLRYEIIIISDCSDDGTLKILKKKADERKEIKLIENKVKTNLPICLNQAIKIANSEIILRHDADDVMLPGRMELQFNYMKRNQDVVLLGGGAIKINELDRVIGKIAHNLSDEKIRFGLISNSQFVHPTVAFRKKDFIDVGGYNENLWTAQDYDLWMRMACKGKMRNLSTDLVKYRVHEGSITSSESRRRSYKDLIKVSQLNYFKNMGFDEYKEKDLLNLIDLYSYGYWERSEGVANVNLDVVRKISAATKLSFFEVYKNTTKALYFMDQKNEPALKTKSFIKSLLLF